MLADKTILEIKMNRNRFQQTLWALTFILVLSVQVFSQAPSNQITVKLDVFLTDGGILYLNDLGLTQLDNAPLIFAVTILNFYPETRDISMRFGIRRGSQTLLEGESKPFSIGGSNNGNPGRLYLTNQNVLADGSPYSLQNIDITDATDDLLTGVLTSGTLPSGVYEFFVEIIDQSTFQMTDHQSEYVTISAAPTVLDLIAPGDPAGNPNLSEIYTTLPFFYWESNAKRFEITICEQMEFNSSPEDVMNNEPRVQQIVEDVKFFQYPSDAWELVEGKTYFWRVTALVSSSGGETRLQSEIWGFRIARVSSGTSGEHQQLLSYLTTLLDSRTMEELFQPGGRLHNFQFSGTVIQNGEAISLQQLNDLINEILQGKFSIKNFTVE